MSEFDKMTEYRAEKERKESQIAEPVAWYDEDFDMEWGKDKPVYIGNWKPLYTQPPAPDAVTEAMRAAGQKAMMTGAWTSEEDEAEAIYKAMRAAVKK